jgi:isopenicillin-N epimerase
VTSRTRLALISHVTSPTGLVFPIESIVRELDRLGVDTLVDAAHAPGLAPINLHDLGAAYWTGNGHKWLCGPKGAGMLYVREDRRAEVQPVVTSHGRNDPRPRPPLWKAFDWPGTLDPTAILALPEAIRVVAGLAGGESGAGESATGGWPAVMAANRAFALEARERLGVALGVGVIAPESMLGAMAAVPLPGIATDADAEALGRTLAAEDRIEVAVAPWPVRAARTAPEAEPAAVLLRVSAQRYNDASDLDALEAALRRRGHVMRAPAAAG